MKGLLMTAFGLVCILGCGSGSGEDSSVKETNSAEAKAIVDQNMTPGQKKQFEEAGKNFNQIKGQK